MSAKLIAAASLGVFTEIVTHAGTKVFLLPTVELKPGASLEWGTKFAATGMFHSIHAVECDKQPVGYVFETRFNVQNQGGCLVTFLRKPDVAQTADVVVKSDELVLYHYPNHGTLAVSPLVNAEVLTIFEEQ